MSAPFRFAVELFADNQGQAEQFLTEIQDFAESEGFGLNFYTSTEKEH